MAEFLQHRSALTLALIGLCAIAVGYLAFAISSALLSAASIDLARAGPWVQFAGTVALLCAAVWVGWCLVGATQWAAALEVAGVALGALFLCIENLLGALSAAGSSHVLTGLGYGMWAGVALALGLKTAIAQRPSPRLSTATGGAAPHVVSAARGASQVESARQIPPLWFCAGFGLLLFAIGSALPPGSYTETAKGSYLGGAIVACLGCAALVASLVSARRRGLLCGMAPILIVGVSLLGVAVLFYGVVELILLSASVTPNAERVLLTVAFAVFAAASVALVASLALQIQRLGRTPVQGAPRPYPARAMTSVPHREAMAAPSPADRFGGPAAEPPPVPIRARVVASAVSPAEAAQATAVRPAAFCSRCGSARSARARFCRSCGTPFDAGA